MKHYLWLFIGTLLASNLTYGATVEVGPTKSVKDLKKIVDGNEYVLDYGSYDFPNIVIKKSLVVRSAKSDARATLKFQSAWGQLPSGGPDLGSPKSAGSIICKGNCVLKDVKTSGGEGVIVFNSQPGSSVSVLHVDMDGGGILRGSGGKSISLVGVQSSGHPTAYFIANFTNPVRDVLVDLSANTLPVQQGGHCRQGKDGTASCKNPGGEAAIRFMQADHVVMKGVVGKEWKYDGKHSWKQFLQLRDSNLIEIYKSQFDIVDIGDMAWRVPPKETKEVRFMDSVLNQVHKTPGWKKIVYVNTKVAGKLLNQTDVK